MKRLLISAQVLLFSLFILSLIITVFQLSGGFNPLSKFDNKEPVYNHIEDYDPSLLRLNTLNKLGHYCDSLYSETIGTSHAGEFAKEYTELVSSVIRKRFYHGYSYYGLDNNYLAVLFSKATVPGYSAVVIPDDILKRPFAACSQQSIVMMELLKTKEFKTRKVSFHGKKSGGHFCFEVFYDGSWHFYDTNMEPDTSVLNAYNRPGIAYLARHPLVLTAAYKRYPSEEILDIFPNYSYGAVNEFPAPRAFVFQKLAKILSYTIWLFFLIAFIFVRRWYKRLSSKKYVRNSRIYFPQPETGTSASYYPGITAPGA